MSSEAYRYEVANRFSTSTLWESLVYKKGDLYCPHFISKPQDPGIRYAVDKLPKFKSTDEALAFLRARQERKFALDYLSDFISREQAKEYLAAFDSVKEALYYFRRSRRG